MEPWMIVYDGSNVHSGIAEETICLLLSFSRHPSCDLERLYRYRSKVVSSHRTPRSSRVKLFPRQLKGFRHRPVGDFAIQDIHGMRNPRIAGAGPWQP